MPKARKPPKDLHRAALLRLLAVARLLRRSDPFNADVAGARLGTCAKTIKRDIRLLRDHGWKVEWDNTEGTYTLRSAPRPSLF